jgi:flagellar protein FlbD
MIHLTRLNSRPFVLNADLIKLIENAPDTVITLLSGEKLVVMETIPEILTRVADFHLRSARRTFSEIVPDTQSHEADAPEVEQRVRAATS